MSSPNGTGNTFHQLFEGAKNNENGFNCVFGDYINPHDPEERYNDRFMWWVNPEYDLNWFKAEIGDKSPREIAQEYCCAFNASGDTFIFHEDIAKLERASKDPVEQYVNDRNVWIWDKPTKDGIYLISCDVSRGDAKDYSAFHVLRVDSSPIEQVAEYKGKIKPDQLGILLMSISSYYNNATIAPENNSGWSGQTILKMEEAQFPFLYYSRKKRTKENVPVDPYYAMSSNDYMPGYSVTSANRLPMLAKMEQYIRLNDIKIKSRRLVEELKTFVMTEGNRPEAQRGYNDDLVMALAGGIWVREEAFMFSYRNDEIAKAMINSLSVSTATTKDFTAFNQGNSNIYNRGIIAEHYEEQNKVKLADGTVESLAWLYRCF